MTTTINVRIPFFNGPDEIDKDDVIQCQEMLKGVPASITMAACLISNYMLVKTIAKMNNVEVSNEGFCDDWALLALGQIIGDITRGRYTAMIGMTPEEMWGEAGEQVTH